MVVRLNDEDHRVHAIYQMGGVRRTLLDIRGILVEKFTVDDEDVTQSITRLERAGLIDKRNLKWDVSKEVKQIIATKIVANQRRRTRP